VCLGGLFVRLSFKRGEDVAGFDNLSQLSQWEAKVKVATILDDKVALRALYDEADKFD
jgi:hypothetical protein